MDKTKTIFENSEGFQKVLAMAKEVREEDDIEKVASLLATNEWVVIGIANNTTFSLIRV